MAILGVRELRENTAEVLRRVREEGVEYIITHRGRPTALLLPIDPERVEQAMVEAGKTTARESWEVYAMLAEVLQAAWPEDLSTQNLMDELRR